MIQLSLYLLVLYFTTLFISWTILESLYHLGITNDSFPNWSEITLPTVSVIAVTSVGIFEVNAIQFGRDQLMEATSDQLRAFIH